MTKSVEVTHPFVLLIEDEPLLRMVLADYIEQAGCEVIEAPTIAKGIRILENRTDIRVVVADLDAPGSVAGLKLAALIRDRWPPIELVLTGSIRPQLDAIPARGVFHDKPFDERQIMASIRQFVGTA